MSNLSEERASRVEYGRRLKYFREEVMKKFKISFAEFAGRVNVQLDLLKSYESGDLTLGLKELEKISHTFCLNIHWLATGRGSRYVIKDEEMIGLLYKILIKKNGSYENYKKLLKSMRDPEIEDLIFTFHEEVLFSTVRIGKEIEKNFPDENIEVYCVLHNHNNFKLDSTIVRKVDNNISQLIVYGEPDLADKKEFVNVIEAQKYFLINTRIDGVAKVLWWQSGHS